jgi:hypothetical protein
MATKRQATKAKAEQAAAKVIALFEPPDVPDFVTDAVMDALIKASKLKGINVWRESEKGQEFDRRALADLFAVSKMLRLDVDENSTAALASLIAAILAHPAAPSRLYQEVANFVNDVSQEHLNEICHTKHFIEKSLERGSCGYVLCPGSTDGVCPGPESHKKREASQT